MLVNNSILSNIKNFILSPSCLKQKFGKQQGPIEPAICVLQGYASSQAAQKLENLSKMKSHSFSERSSGFKEEILGKEIQQTVRAIEKSGELKNYSSRADAFLDWIASGKSQAPNCKSIIDEVRSKAKNYDAIFLSGSSENVPTEWYGEGDSRDYYRSLVEIGLIAESRKRGIPLMGTCRGMQVASVFYGAKLKTNLSGQSGDQPLESIDKNAKGLLRDLFKNPVSGMVCHNQGVGADGDLPKDSALDPVTVYDGLIKALEPKEGGVAPIILTQFHPENRGDKANEQFFKVFYGASETYKLKRAITPEALLNQRANLKRI